MQNNLQRKRESFVSLIEQIQLVSPLATIARGYSITRTNKKVVNSITQVTVDNEITVQVTDGEIQAKVVQIEPT